MSYFFKDALREARDSTIIYSILTACLLACGFMMWWTMGDNQKNLGFMLLIVFLFMLFLVGSLVADLRAALIIRGMSKKTLCVKAMEKLEKAIEEFNRKIEKGNPAIEQADEIIWYSILLLQLGVDAKKLCAMVTAKAPAIEIVYLANYEDSHVDKCGTVHLSYRDPRRKDQARQNERIERYMLLWQNP